MMHVVAEKKQRKAGNIFITKELAKYLTSLRTGMHLLKHQ